MLDTAKCLFPVDLLTASAKQQRDTPQTGETYQRINDSADNSILPTEDPSNQIEFKDADQTPVQRSYDGKDQCNCIHLITSI